MTNSFRKLCEAPEGQIEVLQGNIAFAAGCVRAGVHAADGYPGTPSSEVIDNGLLHVPDLIQVGWSVNEAVASAVGFGHSLAGRDCVVTMKIPGLFQAGDIFTTGSTFTQPRGALIYYIASDFIPSSTQHTIDPRVLFRNCFIPVIEPRTHQEMHEAANLAVEISRKYRTQVVIMPGASLCHSEGLVRLIPQVNRDPVEMGDDLHSFNILPGQARAYFHQIMKERLPGLIELAEGPRLNIHTSGGAKTGVITSGVCDMYVREVKQALNLDLDILSIGITNPLPEKLIGEFCKKFAGKVYVFEDGYKYLQESMQRLGISVIGKEDSSTVTEWNPALIAEKLGFKQPPPKSLPSAVFRPPVICAGCPYRLFAQEVVSLRKKGKLETVFGDIGCNALLYFMNALDTGLAMGASEGMRTGYVLSHPEKAARCISVIGDSTECHSGMDGTRNTVYRNVPGVKVVLDNEWAAMTGGQTTPTTHSTEGGAINRFDLPGSLQAHGANVIVTHAYDRKALRKDLLTALADAENGKFTTIVVQDGPCIQKVPAGNQRVFVEPDVCKKCGICLICPGIEAGADNVPHYNNLCTGCGNRTPSCVQMCPTSVLKTIEKPENDDGVSTASTDGLPGIDGYSIDADKLPGRLSLAIRGVGGQGNLFFGRVLARLAMLAGYDQWNIIKGETHGMSQMGGPVISTFGCGDIISPINLPHTADCLIVMEKGEILRPEFLDLLKPGGPILMADTRIIPFGSSGEKYPTDEVILNACIDNRVIRVDVLKSAIDLGDKSGRMANIVMMGVLSNVKPFNFFPAELWLEAIKIVNSRPEIFSANRTAFLAGREINPYS